MYLKQCGWIQLAFNSLMCFCSNQRGRGATGSGSVTAGGQETRHLSVGPPLSPACSSTSDCKSLQVGQPPPGFHQFARSNTSYGRLYVLSHGCVFLFRRALDAPHSTGVVEAAPVPDLLGSILSGQSMLLMDSSDVIINRDGSLKASKPRKSFAMCFKFTLHGLTCLLFNCETILNIVLDLLIDR